MVILMRALMGLIKDRHGTYYAQRKVPERLQEAVARVLNSGRERHVFLKKSLGTKVLKTANVAATHVLGQFDRTIADAEALLKERPVIPSLTDAQIKRMAETYHARRLAYDEEERREGTGSEQIFQSIAKQLADAGIKYSTPFEVGNVPEAGLSEREVAKREGTLDYELATVPRAFARGDISVVREELDELLDAFQLNVDRKSASYRKLGMAVLAAHVRAIKDIERRNAGEPIETPQSAYLDLPASVDEQGGTLKAAFEGWKKERERAKGTLHEYGRAVEMFVQLHGNLFVANIKKTQAREFREALQLVPVATLRTGKLKAATLPELADYGRKHPRAARVTSRTVNKQLGAVQAVARWAFDKGYVPDEAQWTDPFNKLRLPEKRSERTSFEIAELQMLFDTPVFTDHKYSIGAHGDAGFWLPILALFSGARQGELGSLTAANVRVDAETKTPLLYFVTNDALGKSLKTDASERVVPVHPEVIRFGFVGYVERRRREDGPDAWLFPLVSPDKGTAGVPAFSKWFGRHLRSAGVEDQAKVFHSFRHTVKDALRRGRADHEIREALIGHSQASSVSAGYGANAMLSRFGAAALSDAINRISYPGLDLSRVKPFASPAQKSG